MFLAALALTITSAQQTLLDRSISDWCSANMPADRARCEVTQARAFERYVENVKAYAIAIGPPREAAIACLRTTVVLSNVDWVKASRCLANKSIAFRENFLQEDIGARVSPVPAAPWVSVIPSRR